MSFLKIQSDGRRLNKLIVCGNEKQRKKCMLIKWKITCLIFQIIFQVLFGHDLDMAALSKFSSKESARTHDQARAVICCVCGKKVKDKSGGVRCVNERLSKLVCQYVYSSFSILNPSHPTAMCGTCRVTLCSWEKV